jgi:uncharacterized protein YrrD
MMILGSAHYVTHNRPTSDTPKGAIIGNIFELYENEGAVHAYRLSDRFFSQMMLFDNGWRINKSKMTVWKS